MADLGIAPQSSSASALRRYVDERLIELRARCAEPKISERDADELRGAILELEDLKGRASPPREVVLDPDRIEIP